MHPQHIAARTVEPGEDDDLVPWSDAVEGIEHRRLEGEPRVRRPLVALIRGRRGIGQRRLDPSDRRYLEAWLIQVDTSGDSWSSASRRSRKRRSASE